MCPAQAAPNQSGGNPAVLLGLVGLVAGGVLFAKQTQPQSDSKGSGGDGSPSASRRVQAPQSAGAHAHTPCWPASLGQKGSTEHVSPHVSYVNVHPIPAYLATCGGLKQQAGSCASTEAVLSVAGHSNCSLLTRVSTTLTAATVICYSWWTFCGSAPMPKTLLAA